MMYDNAPKKQYAAYTAANHAINKTRQIVMLYDGIIRFISQAKDAIVRKDIQDRYNSLDKATTIISGLQASLDHKQGGEIAKMLYHFYSSIYSRLMDVHYSHDLEACDAVIKELKVMREAWADVDNNASDGESPVPAVMSTSESANMQVSV